MGNTGGSIPSTGTNLNWRRRGNIGIARAILYYSNLDYTVSIPLTDSQPYDLVVDIGSKLQRIQVKTVHGRDKYGSYEVGLRVNGGNTRVYTSKDFDNSACDILFVAIVGGDDYAIPTIEIDAKTTLGLGPKWSRYKILHGTYSVP